jgi:hypothetical protein
VCVHAHPLSALAHLGKHIRYTIAWILRTVILWINTNVMILVNARGVVYVSKTVIENRCLTFFECTCKSVGYNMHNHPTVPKRPNPWTPQIYEATPSPWQRPSSVGSSEGQAPVFNDSFGNVNHAYYHLNQSSWMLISNKHDEVLLHQTYLKIWHNSRDWCLNVSLFALH